jgi:hypothetical protein
LINNTLHCVIRIWHGHFSKIWTWHDHLMLDHHVRRASVSWSCFWILAAWFVCANMCYLFVRLDGS